MSYGIPGSYFIGKINSLKSQAKKQKSDGAIKPFHQNQMTINQPTNQKTCGKQT